MTSPSSRTPTSTDDLRRINAMVEAIGNLIGSLAGRWLDESKYENIDDYAVPIRKALPEGFTLKKMTKRPFGFQFTIGTDAIYAVRCTMSSYGWKRIN